MVTAPCAASAWHVASTGSIPGARPDPAPSTRAHATPATTALELYALNASR